MIREQLADEIFAQLPADEEAAMLKWREGLNTLKSTELNLPVLDVLTCVYNAEKYIANSIENIVLQSYPNIHLVIVTDPCTDKTIDIIKSYLPKYPNIELVENTEHKGIIECFNIGLTHCKSDYIARMDLDDLIHPMRFEKQMKYLLSHPDVGAVSAWMKIFNEKHETKDVTYRDDFDLQKITLLFFSPISHAASIFKSAVLKSFGYRDSFKYAEDYDLWFQIMGKYKTAMYPEFLYLYRTHSNQVTNERNQQIIKDSWAVIMKNLFDAIGIVHTTEDIHYHINHCLLPKEAQNKEEWFNYSSWLNRIVDANSRTGFFNHEKLKQFLYMNYWSTGFNKFSKEMKAAEIFSQVFSPVNPSSFLSKFKTSIKHIFQK